jgi:L-galactose dehydrogenase
MEYRELGQTGMQLSVLSYGASSLGGVFQEIDESQGIRAVHTAIDSGINFVDVSPFYGLNKAETVLGKALREIPRDRYLLATKCGRYGMEQAEFDFSAARVCKSVDESLQRLGVDHLDLIQVHDMEFGNIDQIVEETLPALQKLRETGKARFVGITGLPLHLFTYVASRVPVGTIDSILSYCHYALNDTALLEIVDELDQHQVGIINASPTGMGLLSTRGTPDWHPAPAEVKRVCKKAARFCEDQGSDIARLAMQFAVAEPRIASTLFSTSKPENVQANVDAITEPIDLELLTQVQQILAPIQNITWPSGLPENSESNLVRS